MLEMRDMFQEEEVYQLQELRMQLEQANKTCRILQYRLRKAERRSIRVAQTGQVDGELIRTLEHDIKVAKSVSLRLHNELESVQKRNSQLEWENEALRERTQELEVAKQVLQAEMEKASSRENSLKRRSVRSPTSKAERRLSQQIEDDSSDLKCQLHFAKEELALMCKKLTKLVSENESMREELAKYHSAYGEIDTTQSPECQAHSALSREAEVKVHLKLVEEEATLLSRRIVELEVENRGLRAEMSDLREKIGGGGEVEEEEEQREAGTESLSRFNQVRGCKGREQSSKMGYAGCEQAEEEKAAKYKVVAEDINQTQPEEMLAPCQIAREGPVGGEWDPLDSQESDSGKKGDRGLRGMTVKDYEMLLALRDHSCIVSSAIQLLTTTPKNGHWPSTFVSEIKVDSPGKGQVPAQDLLLQGPLNEALELLQTMLLAFTARVEKLLTGVDLSGISIQKDEHFWDSYISSFVSGSCAVNGVSAQNKTGSPSKQDSAEDLRTLEVKERAKQKRQGPPTDWDFIQSCRDPRMWFTLQILWVLHQWCQATGPGQEEKEARVKTISVLRKLLQELGAELQDGGIQTESEAKATQGDTTEVGKSAANAIFDEGRHYETDRKNWCYLNQEAAQLDQQDPIKTWDHPIMPLSFPDLDFEQVLMERSHTAPERTNFRIYYSPPSARRVLSAQLQQSPITDRDSLATTASPWCTPPSSFSPVCLGLSPNLSDDMKEMTASWRQLVQSSSLEGKRGRLGEGWVDVACSGTQTQMQPQMVSIGLQTDGPQGVCTVRKSPSRVPNSSLVSTRTYHHTSYSSLERVTSRIERPKSNSTSPKLYRRHSASGSSSLPSSTSFSSSLSSSSSSATSSREQALWNLPVNAEAGNSVRTAKTPTKPVGTNRYGLVTEFLRRVSGRTEKPVPGAGQKGTTGLKNLERIPTRPPAGPLHRNDSVTRIVNQRFMKQREEKGSSPGQVMSGTVRKDHSLTTITGESSQAGKYARPQLNRLEWFRRASYIDWNKNWNRCDYTFQSSAQALPKQGLELPRAWSDQLVVATVPIRMLCHNFASARSTASCVCHFLAVLTSIPAEEALDGNYDCGSSSTLTFCFARPSRPSQRQTSNQSKLHRPRYSLAVSRPGNSNFSENGYTNAEKMLESI
ncbi:protein SOGA1-like [Lampris incognitus]|uniref:protein SOGA1-like n=1 Tax=Lampris incognitus TaxID=2546036 RepID=UPI0024B62560|nr:protein SOGA1-like [Lampris incognitus]